jgi:hypothetical protein
MIYATPLLTITPTDVASWVEMKVIAHDGRAHLANQVSAVRQPIETTICERGICGGRYRVGEEEFPVHTHRRLDGIEQGLMGVDTAALVEGIPASIYPIDQVGQPFS